MSLEQIADQIISTDVLVIGVDTYIAYRHRINIRLADFLVIIPAGDI